MLDSFTNWLNHNSWLNLVFLVLAVTSIMISIYLFIRSRKEKAPHFSIRTFKLIEDSLTKIEAVEILYQGKRVKNLTLSKIALWNKGRDSINANDIAPTDPLKIGINPQYQLLAAEIICSQTKANNFSITPNLENNEVKIDFDYFDTNEGVVIQVYHTGKQSEDVSLKGTVKGVTRITHIVPGEDYLTDSFVARVTSSLRIRKIKSGPLRLTILIFLALLTLPIGLPLLIIDLIMKPWRRIPRQFNLD